MNVSRRKFLQSAALGSATLALASKLRADGGAPAILGGRKTKVSKAPEKPNLLLLWSDQVRGDSVSWAGNPVIRSPHLGRLAEQSFVFGGAHCTQPVCTPSRGSILTGLWPHHHRAIQNNDRLPDDVRTIAEHVPANDYATAYFGKWHLGDELRAQHGFREWRSIEDGIYRAYYTHPEDLKLRSSYHYHLLRKGYPPNQIEKSDKAALFSREFAAALPENYTKVDYIAEEAVRFLRERRDGQPFLLSVNSLEPHPPTFGPLNECYDPSDVPVGPAFCKPVGPDASYHNRRTYEGYKKKGYDNFPLETEYDWRRVRADYYGLITMVDNAYGRILRALEESGLADNTIVVYTSDHGDMSGDHCLMQKSVFYEQATHVPLVIHVPWLSRDRVQLDGPFSLVNLTPTLLELMGRDVSSGFDGRSYAGVLRDSSSWRTEDIVVEWYDDESRKEDGRSLVKADGWKLNLYRDYEPELQNLNADPGELRNFARDPSERDRIARMADEIRAWQAGTRDDLPLTV